MIPRNRMTWGHCEPSHDGKVNFLGRGIVPPSLRGGERARRYLPYVATYPRSLRLILLGFCKGRAINVRQQSSRRCPDAAGQLGARELRKFRFTPSSPRILAKRRFDARTARSMAAWQRRGGLAEYRDKLISGMLDQGYSSEFPNRSITKSWGLAPTDFRRVTAPPSRCSSMHRRG